MCAFTIPSEKCLGLQHLHSSVTPGELEMRRQDKHYLIGIPRSGASEMGLVAHQDKSRRPSFCITPLQLPADCWGEGNAGPEGRVRESHSSSARQSGQINALVSTPLAPHLHS